jgi:DNA-directed RNA polymerase specialized sigma24 family protein
MAETDDISAEKGKAAKASQQTELKRAKQAAISGDVVTYMEALFDSRLLDALAWRLRGQLPDDDVDAIIAEAIGGTYDAIQTHGAKIDLAAWLSKTCYNQVRARYSMRKNVVAVESQDLERLSGADQTQLSAPSTRMEQEEAEERSATRRVDAIKLARTLLPRIGEGNIQKVMAVVLDAIEQELVDLSPDEISGMVGLTPDTVRRLISRGFERFEREARQDGLWLDISDALILDQENPF